MTQPRWFPSPAKFNLFLHVTGRRADGYHDLQTIFQFLGYGDEIGFEIIDNGEIQRIDQHYFELPEIDLSVRAAELLKTKCNRTTLGARIHLKKVVPPGTGLGAGSSNAATVLLVLNILWDLGLSTTELLELGTTLGADVPVFLHGKATWAEGIGERFTDCTPATSWVCVALPNTTVSTADAFAELDFRPNRPLVNWNDFLNGRTGNDLQENICSRFPEIAHALEHLKPFGNALMSGTGSAVFVCVDSETAANEALSSLPSPLKGFIAPSQNHSSLHQALAAFEG